MANAEPVKEEKPKSKPAAEKTESKKPAETKPAKKKPTTTKPKTTTTAKKPASKKATPEKTEEQPVEEKTKEEYIAKKKPELSKELKEQLQKRKQIKKRTPDFIREEWFRYKRIPHNWRRPDGITSKMRKNLKYRPSKVRIGFRGPRGARGLHSSGFEEILVYNVNDIGKINPKTQAARIGGTVGTKKRIEIEKKAEELDIRILNM